MIDELRSFYDEGANFSLILVGLPPLLSKTMKLSINQPMKQRINMVVELEPMSPTNLRIHKTSAGLCKIKNTYI